MAWKDAVAVTAGISVLFYYPTHHQLQQNNQQRKQQARENNMGDDNDANVWSSNFVGPVLLDVDGDGAAEAWVVLRGGQKSDGTDSYQVQVLDLKRNLYSSSTGDAAGSSSVLYAGGGPFLPPPLVESSPEYHTNMSLPVAVATGHLPVMARNESARAAGEDSQVENSKNDGNDVRIDDRNRRYFCGRDWHDATTRCGTPCPRGDSSSCPDDERCFADTECDYYEHLKKQQQEKERGGSWLGLAHSAAASLLTPAGSVPVVVTAWERGHITCDGILVNNVTKRLEVRNLWTVQPIPALNLTLSKHGREAESYDPLRDPLSPLGADLFTTKVDWIDAPTSGTSHGMILLTASMLLDDEDDEVTRFVIALNARTGEVIWETLSEQVDAREVKEVVLLPVSAGAVSSAARRRTVAHRSASSSQLLFRARAPDCLHSFKRSLLESALPYVHWTEDDVKSRVLHFDPQVKLRHQLEHDLTKQRSHSKHKTPSNRWWDSHRRQQPPSSLSRRQQQLHPKRGRPNVVITSTGTGLSVRSLKNGHELCRLSLWDRTLYADLNHDGMLDSVHIVTMHHRLYDDDSVDPKRSWISQLAARVNEEHQQQRKPGKPGKEQEVERSSVSLCHLQALSGLPSTEELFSVNVCAADKKRRGSGIDQQLKIPQEDYDFLQAAPPLLVEGRGRNRRGHDVVTAVSGVVTRIDGETGKKQWQVTDSLPVWDQDDTVLLTRVELVDAPTLMIPPRARPILLVGEDGMLLLSPAGRKLASIKFPQPSLARPVLMDVNGDGVMDVVVTTTDAIWAYPIHLRATSTSLFRMAVGFVLLGILLSLLRNRFQQNPGKRATDL
jgi:hypothetical protein